MILINNLKDHATRHRAVVSAAVTRVIDSGWVVLGPAVEQFEAEFAAYIGVGHMAGVANGTDALEIALRAVGIGKGTKVGVVANAGMYGTLGVLSCGATPLFMDVTVPSGLVCRAEVERVVDAGAEAVIITHLYGRAVPETAAIADLCRSRGVALIEDCAQAHGARLGGRRVGAFGDLATFSFYPTKNLGAFGDGGAIATNNADLARKVRLLRQYGWDQKYVVATPHGRNSRLDEMQAAILSALLPELDGWNAARPEIAALYGTLIRHKDVALPLPPDESDVAHLFIVRSDQRDSLRAHLKLAGIASDIHYPLPDYRQPILKDRDLPLLAGTEALARTILTLPCYPELAHEDVRRIAGVINAWVP